MLLCVCSAIYHTRRQNVARTSVKSFLPHLDVICDLLLNRRTATWNLVVKLTTVSKCLRHCHTSFKTETYSFKFLSKLYQRCAVVSDSREQASAKNVSRASRTLARGDFRVRLPTLLSLSGLVNKQGVFLRGLQQGSARNVKEG